MWARVILKLKIQAFEPVGLGVPDGLNSAAREKFLNSRGPHSPLPELSMYQSPFFFALTQRVRRAMLLSSTSAAVSSGPGRLPGIDV
jgi:hypothetical protein